MKVDAKKYAKLLTSVLPQPITSDEQNRRLLSISSRLIQRGDKRSPEESTLLRLLAVLISEYEFRRYDNLAAGSHSPGEVLQHLMEENHLSQTDFPSIPQSRISDILAGKRKISRSQAQILSQRFKVNPSLFLY